jgi:heterodisulfide reductase subunit C
MAQDTVSRYRLLSAAYVASETARCVQCGVCSYNCPLGNDVRARVRRGRRTTHACLMCGECVRRCPRGVLTLNRMTALAEKV